MEDSTSQTEQRNGGSWRRAAIMGRLYQMIMGAFYGFSGTILKASVIQESTSAFWDCVERSDKLIALGFLQAGTAAAAERTCALYTNSIGVAGRNVSYNLYYIDQETDISLDQAEVS